MTEKDELKPCPTPWCHGVGELRSYGGFQIICYGTDDKTGCGVEGPECATPEGAAAAWNHRIEPEAADRGVSEALAEAKHRRELTRSCNECNADDVRFWDATIKFLGEFQ